MDGLSNRRVPSEPLSYLNLLENSMRLVRSLLTHRSVIIKYNEADGSYNNLLFPASQKLDWQTNFYKKLKWKESKGCKPLQTPHRDKASVVQLGLILV